jgi:hypothetical protein
LEIILQLTKDSCGTRKFPKQASTSLYEKDLCHIGSPQVLFFLGKLTYVLKEEETKSIRGIPHIYNVNRNIKQQMAIS